MLVAVVTPRVFVATHHSGARARERLTRSFARHVEPTATRYLVVLVVSTATKIAMDDSVALNVLVALFDLTFLVLLLVLIAKRRATLKACGETHALEM